LTLSVVIPTRNTRELTVRCLDSLAHLAGAGPLEIVVVDDASSDDSVAALAALHPQATLLSNATPLGFSAAANRGLRAARGDLLLLLNSDTEVLAGTLAAFAEAFRIRPLLGIAGAQLYYPDRRPQWSGGPFPSLLWLFALATGLPPKLAAMRGARPAATSTRPVGWVTGAAMVLRRPVWERLGPLDEGYSFYAQDLDLCYRAAAGGWEVAVVGAAPVIHHHGSTIRAHADSVARQNPALLWSDLLRWSKRARGPAWATRARLALAAGAGLRLAARALVALSLSGERGRAHARVTAAYVSATRALFSKDPG
jgi:GT2 family glycosyltransferase